MSARPHSKIISVISILLVLGGGFFLLTKHSREAPAQIKPTEPTPAVSDSVVPDGQYCFARSQKATDTEPYAVDEHILIYMWDNTMVVGRKTGTQNGPDMTNGYVGLLSGTRAGNNLEVVFSYTIEGSTNKELELYTLGSNSLIKSRWPLIESKDKILIPNKIGTPTLITYTPEPCPE